MSNAPFPITPHLTAIALAYSNRRLIADQVLPRVPVGAQEFKYLKHDLAQGITIPNTRIGRKSKPNEVEFSATETPSATEDYALEDAIPQRDIDNAPENYDPVGRATEGLTDLILLDREKRVADLVFAAANYATANKETLSGTDQFNDKANSSPIDVIEDALNTPLMRPNIMTIGQAVYTQLVRHPDIVKAFNGTSGDKGIVPGSFLAELFQLDGVFVGQAYLNSAKKGQAVSTASVWGKHIALIYRDQLATADRGTTFGFTAQFGDRVSGQRPDPDIGLNGGQRVRVGESVKELITANDLGYFIQNAVA